MGVCETTIKGEKERQRRCLEVIPQHSEILGGVGAVTHLDVDVQCYIPVDPLHGEKCADPLALLKGASVSVRPHVEQLEAQTFEEHKFIQL